MFLYCFWTLFVGLSLWDRKPDLRGGLSPSFKQGSVWQIQFLPKEKLQFFFVLKVFYKSLTFG
jgi:hypothetical protein